MYGILLMYFFVALAGSSLKLAETETDPKSNSPLLNLTAALYEVASIPNGNLLCLSLLNSSFGDRVYIPEKSADNGAGATHGLCGQDPCREVDSPAYLPLAKSDNILYYYGTILQGSEQEVRLFCNYHNMKLVSIESMEKSELLITSLSQFLGESQNLKFWTSGKKHGAVWNWDSIGYPVHYTNWGPGQPSETGGNKTCIEAVLNVTAQTLLWNDMDCKVANYFICESPIQS